LTLKSDGTLITVIYFINCYLPMQWVRVVCARDLFEAVLSGGDQDIAFDS